MWTHLKNHTVKNQQFHSYDWLDPGLGVGLLLMAFVINLSGNRLIEGVASFIGFLKIGGIIVLAWSAYGWQTVSLWILLKQPQVQRSPAFLVQRRWGFSHLKGLPQ